MNTNDLSAHLNDPARLAALRNIALLDTPTEEAFDRLTRLAANSVNAPFSLVSLIDADRQFIKSAEGLPEPWLSRREMPLSHSFCQHNRCAGQPLLIEDARRHPFFKDNPAIQELNVIAYLGFPLIASDGYVLGSLCVIDTEPREWTPKEVSIIQDLTAAVMSEIQLRTEISARDKAEAQRDDLNKLNKLLQFEVSARKQIEEKLQTLNEELERRVEERTQELQETQAQYLHAEKLSTIGTLSASIAHEFNNPLQSILTILKSLKQTEGLEEDNKKMLNLAIGEGERIKNLIRDLREFNRPSSGKKVLMDVHASINSSVLLCKSDFSRKGIRTKLNSAQQLPQILAVKDQIKQVILNLLANAADACRPGDVITISTWQEEEKIAVAIKDNGTGIEPEKMGLIFQPFYTTKPTVKGTGLGLSICNGIVENHQGEIRVESQPGVGSTFTVILPTST